MIRRWFLTGLFAALALFLGGSRAQAQWVFYQPRPPTINAPVGFYPTGGYGYPGYSYYGNSFGYGGPAYAGYGMGLGAGYASYAPFSFYSGFSMPSYQIVGAATAGRRRDDFAYYLVQPAEYQTSSRTAAEEVATVDVLVPEQATLWFNGRRMEQTGSERRFTTPPLTPGGTYSYEVRARWVEGGRVVERTRSLRVHPGASVTLDFSSPTP